jgi:hypothetical protein
MVIAKVQAWIFFFINGIYEEARIGQPQEASYIKRSMIESQNLHADMICANSKVWLNINFVVKL